MLLKIDTDKGTAVEFVDHSGHEVSPLDEALGRIRDETEGWRMYAHMFEKHGSDADKRYAIASHQEFMHLCMALDDFFGEVRKLATPEELVQLDALKESL